MTTQLALKITLGQNPLELGSVEVAEASTPAFLTTALKNIGVELSANAHVYPDKFSSISVQPIIGALKKFIIIPEDAVKPVEETRNTEVLASGKELENKGLLSALSQHAITVLEKTTHSHDALEKINEVFLKLSKKLRFKKRALNWLSSDLNGVLL